MKKEELPPEPVLVMTNTPVFDIVKDEVHVTSKATPLHEKDEAKISEIELYQQKVHSQTYL